MARAHHVGRRRRRPRLLQAEFWLTALDDAVRHGATSALGALGGDALGIVHLATLREVALLGVGGFLASLLASLARPPSGALARADG